MANHTPGPWTTNEAEHDSLFQDIKIKGGYHSIAYVWFDDAPVPDFNAEQRANAKLIVAAPDLLAACEIALQFCGEYPEVYDQVADAIARAKGRDNE